ncbi:MarR family winged helix-turn-helix transcriptional regulator [Clostridium lundense]|uniref:MarR family winged helix-turn-helix transcriptional regulator n=1 Tax=Clostridium lundense TaxID=319475 RepID=UPI0005591FE5|nr:MarR family transcriptional regulator [Clostridium lundense]
MDFNLLECIGFVTNTAIKAVSDDFNKRLERYGCTRIQWIALYFLYNADQPISQKELATLMKVQGSSLARLIDRMERDGLIKRIENSEDKRIKFLELTAEGQLKIKTLLPEGEKFSNLLLDGITTEELDIFNKVIDKMLNNIKK